MRRWSFAKGHGTQNDFVLLQDRESMLDPGAADVRMICDRHVGIGADGLLRAVLAKHVEGWQGDGDLWFMDYRNADGSVAEMCGNGLRVFARYLLDEGLVTGLTIPIATRSGLLEATDLHDGRIRVSMGPTSLRADQVRVTVSDGRTFDASSVDVGNPHAVSFVDDVSGIPLRSGPRFVPADAFPEGVNCEFVEVVGDRHLAMRVYERGVGETRSCGTGTVAAAVAAAARDEAAAQARDQTDGARTYRVDVLGGTVEVELTAEQAFLTGPAVLVARGEMVLPDEE